MTQGEFDQLTEKYLSGTCTPEEKALLERWTAHQFKLSQDQNAQLDQEVSQETEARVWLQLQDELGFTPKPKMKHWHWMAVAAGLLLIVGSFTWHRLAQFSRPDNEGTLIQNLSTGQQKVNLPDGSMVILARQASLTTLAGYGKTNRKVILQGEAFFQVKPNAKIPFLVYSGSLIAEVLGTSFRIKPQVNGQNIEVAVKTGRVSVYTPSTGSKARNGVVLSPNQKVVFDVKSKTLQEGIVDRPQRLETIEPSQPLHFEETPLADILALLQHDFGVEIIVTNPMINYCTFTGDLDDLNLYQQLEILCSTINANYEVRGAEIFVSGHGCQ